ncbi:hypothetical protein V8C44DRAFT_320182 [Trichoderma aethiopicum]
MGDWYNPPALFLCLFLGLSTGKRGANASAAPIMTDKDETAQSRTGQGRQRTAAGSSRLLGFTAAAAGYVVTREANWT